MNTLAQTERRDDLKTESPAATIAALEPLEHGRKLADSRAGVKLLLIVIHRIYETNQDSGGVRAD